MTNGAAQIYSLKGKQKQGTWKKKGGSTFTVGPKKKKQSLPYGWCLNICNKTMCINLYTNNEISLND